MCPTRTVLMEEGGVTLELVIVRRATSGQGLGLVFEILVKTVNRMKVAGMD